MADLDFGAAIAQFQKKTLTAVNSQCLTITQELFTSIVNLTPSPTNRGEHADGLLANQWYPEVGDSFSSEIGTDISPYGAASLARIAATVQGSQAFFGKDGIITLANNVPYGVLAEELGWEPPQWTGKVKPYKMVAKSMQIISVRYK